MAQAERMFVPAAGHDWLLPFYDPLTKLLGVDQARRDLVTQAALQPLHRVLEVGCGTGALSILIKMLHPDVEVVALDPDVKALARARHRTERAGVSIEFVRGFSDALRYPDATFDRVFSSMMFHHLEFNEKEKTLREIHRVLKPGGRLQMLDFGGPESGAGSGLVRLFHFHHRLQDNDASRILGLMERAGLVAAKRTAERRILFGRLAYYQASRHL
jgi:ubiquinone/menaquinone biosynthesis C-methylase UbiE